MASFSLSGTGSEDSIPLDASGTIQSIPQVPSMAEKKCSYRPHQWYSRLDEPVSDTTAPRAPPPSEARNPSGASPAPSCQHESPSSTVLSTVASEHSRTSVPSPFGTQSHVMITLRNHAAYVENDTHEQDELPLHDFEAPHALVPQEPSIDLEAEPAVSRWRRYGRRVSRRLRREPELRLLCVVYLSQIACVVLALLKGFVPELFGVSGDECARETICANNWWEFILLMISRMSGYAMYPPMLLPFVTKCHGLCGHLQVTRLSQLFPFNDLHFLHRQMGLHLVVLTTVHGLAHLLRWGLQEAPALLATQSGITGFIATGALMLIAFPMLPFLRDSLLWGWRKTLHHLALVFATALALHAPATSIGWIMLAGILLYVFDALYMLVVRTFKVTAPEWTVMNQSLLLRFENPKGFSGDHGYIQICDPRARRSQHPVAVFPDASDPKFSCAHIQVVGAERSWSHKMQHDLLVEESYNQSTAHPIWVQGPVNSPYDVAGDYENAIFVATGIGFTSALAPLARTRHRGSVHFIWSCRDLSQIFTHLPAVALNSRALNFIFYTGKDSIDCIECPPCVWLVKGRPSLSQIIPHIILQTEHKKGAPLEDVLPIGPLNPPPDMGATPFSLPGVPRCRLDRWRVWYCGDAEPVRQELGTITNGLQIPFKMDERW